MAGQGTVTASEEVQRYYRKAKALAEPLVNQITTKNEADFSTSGPNTAEPMFEDNADSEDDEWVDVIGSVQTPEENHEENYRLATGTGPIQTAGGVFVRKVGELGSAAANKASQVPGAMKVVAENQTERLAEVVGRVTVSSAVAGVLQRYPLLERWRVAFFRGRGVGSEESEESVVVSSPPDHQSDSQEQALLAELPLIDVADDGMEEVPLYEVDDQEQEDDWAMQ